MFAQDGDGLAGLARDDGISGNGVLLATLLVQALAPGDATIIASFSPGELTEGFPLDPSGFEPEINFIPTLLSVPEPSAAWLLALSMGAFGVLQRLAR